MGNESAGLQQGGSIKWEAAVLVFVVGVCICAVVVYFAQFTGTVSNRQDVFGHFGNYVGGVVGSLAALATVLLVWRTVQRMEEANSGLMAQIELQRSSAALSEMRYRLHRVVEEIEKPGAPLHSRPLGHVSDLLREFGLPANPTLGELLADLRFLVHSSSIATEIWQSEVATRQMQHLGRQLLELVYCIKRYDELAQETSYTNHFRIRFEVLASALCEINMISADAHRVLSAPIGDLHDAWGRSKPVPGKSRCDHGLHRSVETMRKNWQRNKRY